MASIPCGRMWRVDGRKYFCGKYSEGLCVNCAALRLCLATMKDVADRMDVGIHANWDDLEWAAMQSIAELRSTVDRVEGKCNTQPRREH